MSLRSFPAPFALAFTAFAGLAAFAATDARADDTIKHPGDHPTYGVEIEPHLLVGWDNIFPGTSFGAGVRFAIPIVQNGFVDTINNSVAISFGADLLHYDGCSLPNNASCSATFVFLPVTIQWNFWVAQKWSVFGEPGLFLYHGFFDDCPVGYQGACLAPSATGVRPAFFAGGRYHFNEKVSLTMRVGYPTVSVGVSFF